MDVIDFINRSGQRSIPNPKYNPKSKKNTEPPTLIVPDSQPYPDQIIEMAKRDAINSFSIDSDVADKYRAYGLNYDPNADMDVQLANAQSNWSKAINALGQTLISEIVLGTFKGISDLFDGVGQAVGLSDHNYSNPVSQVLEKAQEDFKEWAPVYSDPNKNIKNGGLTDFGWWMSNMPSIASSLTLLIPSTLATKGLSYLGKATKVGRNISKFTNRAARAVANPVAHAFGRSGFTKEQMGVFFETGINAALSRTMENYQEARQTYNDTYIDAAQYLKDMSDEQYNAFVQRNADYLKNSNIDVNNKDEVAKQIARSSADRTFQLDLANVIFDAYQIYGLRNILTHAPKFNTNAATRRAQREAIRTAGMNAEQATAELAKDSKLTKAVNWFGDKFLGVGRQIKSELSEGVEEAINYIAQQEGNHLGKYLLTGESGDNRDLGFFSSIGPMHKRILNDYINDASLWDSAFWGVIGGVVFQAGGSKLNRLSQTIKNRSEAKKSANKDNAETQEAKLTPHWWMLDQSAETERMIGEINSRNQKLNNLREQMQKINAGKNPYIVNEDKSNPDISSPVEERMLREKAYSEYLDEMIISARNNGTLNMLESYLEDSNVRQAIVDAYQSGDQNNKVSKEEAEQAASRAAERIRKIDRLYQDEIIHASDIADKITDDDGTSLPAEYIQMIASSNVRHRLNLERYDEVAAMYNEDTERIKAVLGDRFDSTIDYQGLVNLHTTIQELSSLVAQKKELEEQQKENPTISRQFDIDEVNTQINVIKRKALQSATDAQLARTIYALQVANSAIREYSPDKKSFKVNASDVDLIANMDKLLTEDLGGIFDEVGQKRRTDVSAEAVIGELKKITNDMRYVLPVDASGKRIDSDLYLEQLDPRLPDNYDILARIELEKIKEDAQLAETEQEIRHYVGAINNVQNVARKKAIEEAYDTLFNIQKNHTDLDIANVANKIYREDSADWLIDTNGLSDEERTNLKNALKLLNLADVKNKELANRLSTTLIFARATQQQVAANNRQNTETGNATGNPQAAPSGSAATQNSSASQNQNGAGQNGQSNNQSGQQSTQSNGQGNGQIGNNVSIDRSKPNSLALKNELPSNTTSSIRLVDLGNGNYELDFTSKGKDVRPDDISDTTLFDIKQQPIDGGVVKQNPIIRIGTNNEIQVVRQGVVENPTISSTGELNGTQANAQSYIDRMNNSNDEAEVEAIYKEGLAVGVPENDLRTAFGTRIQEIRNNAKPRIEPEAPVKGADPAEYIPQIIVVARNAAIKLKNGESTTYEEYLADPAMQGIRAVINDDITFEKLAKEHWNRQMERLAAKYPEAVNNILNVLQSSTSEEIPESNLKKKFDTTFTKAVESLVKAYLKDIGQKKINGKYVISLENLLRYCNGEFQNNENAEVLYNVLASYLKSDDAKNLYDVIEEDYEINSNDFLDKVKTPLEERVDKAIREENHRINTISIRDKSVFDELEEGQELTTTEDADRIYFHFNGKDVGYIGKPRVVNGTYSSPYKYWLFRIRPNGKDTYYSRLADVFKSIVNAKDGDLKEIYDAALSKAVSLKDNKTWDKIKEEYGINTRNNETGEELDDVNEQMLSVIRTMASFAVKYGSADKAIDGWFNALAQEYMAAHELSQNKNAKVVIDAITDGFLIRATDKLTDNNGNIIPSEVDKLPLASEAIGKNSKGKVAIGIGSRKNPGTIETVVKKENDNVIIPASNSLPGVGYANTFVVFPLSKGKTAYAQAFPITAKNLKPGSEAAKIATAFRKRIDYYLQQIANNPTDERLFTELQDFLFEALNYKGTTTPLFHMDNCEKVNKNSFDPNQRGTHIGTNGRNGRPRRDLHIFYNKNGNPTISIDRTDSRKRKDIPLNKTNLVVISDEIRKFLSDTLQFNISANYIASDNNTRNQVEGLATRDKDGKFVVKIGDDSWTFDSYNDFILDNDLVRVNTKPNEHGNNVTRTSSNPNVRYKFVTSSPVERITPTATNTFANISAQANQIMSSDRTDKAAQLARLIFDDDIVTTLSVYDLLPHNLIFDASFNTGDGRENINASFNRRTKVTTIGPRFLAMLSNPNEAYRKQAIRKLIHERLHDILHSNGNEHYIQDIRNIFEQFKQYNKDNNASEKYTKYEYNNKNTEEERLEEFLVDSLTSQELAQYLNSITGLSKVNMRERKRDTLLNKIMRLLAKIMGVRIKNDSLYAQEFEALRSVINSTPEIVESFDEANTNEQEVTKEQNPDTTETEEPVQEEVNEVDEEDENANNYAINNPLGFDEYESSTTEVIEDTSLQYDNEMQDIKAKAIADGTFMKAPNGNPTNLNERQWLQVRTKAFKEWFGDWINDPANASKVVDENGEPLVVYHGNRTDNKITAFDLSKKGSEHREREISGFWFVNSERIATNEYAFKVESWGTGNPKFGETLGVFLNIKNPVIAEQDIKEEMSPYGPMQFSKEKIKDFIHNAKLRQTDSTDGFILTMLDSDGDDAFGQSKQIQFVAFMPNQIKSATDNSGLFSTENDDIRYSSTTEEIEGNLLYQKQLLTKQTRALWNVKESIDDLGSVNNIRRTLINNEVDGDIADAIIKAVEQEPRLGKYRPLTVYRIIRQAQESGLQKDYNTYIQQPVDKRLEELLINYLKPFNVNVLEDDVVEKYGVIGLYDILNKAIHLSKDRNSITLTEEFAHAFVELMGAKTSGRKENADYTFLYNIIDTTSLYKQVYDQYKDTYIKKDENGNTVPDIAKIKKEAIGQALATAINNNWNNKVKQEERSFWQKLKDWFNNILNYFASVDNKVNEFLGTVNEEGYIEVEDLLNKIANEVINNNRERLRKVDDSKYKLLDYAETINQQTEKDGGLALDFMQWYTSIGNIITGSLAYRRQGTVYRSSVDALHDIDMIVPKDTHGIDLNNKELVDLLNNKNTQNQAIGILLETPYFKKVIAQYPDLELTAAYPDGKGGITINSIWSKNKELKDKFNSLPGSYADRLEQFTEEERDQIYLFDFFVKNDNNDESFIEDETDIRLSKSYVSFKSKLAFGRAKDIYDYQMWKLYDEFVTNAMSDEEYLMYQRREQENYEQVASVADYIQSYSPEDRAEVAEEINNGELSIMCN